MTGIHIQTPALLWLLPLALLPLWRGTLESGAYSSVAMWPSDGWSRAFDFSLKLVGAGAFAGLVLGMAGPTREGGWSEKSGYGADIVLLLDRSNSMDHSFAGRAPSGGEESKSQAARRLLGGFVNARRHDRYGVVSFSTAPLFVQPLTDNREATLAAVDALATPALAYTHVGKGLAMALNFFPPSHEPGSRVVLLISDGAAVLDPAGERLLRTQFLASNTRLYWLFLRTANTPGLFEASENPDDDTPQSRPERHLHLFFESLGVPYRAFEAESPEKLAAFIAEIDRLERAPLKYREREPCLDLTGYCYGWAVLCLVYLGIMKWLESRGGGS
ncbi:vWA domain-containing protein [Methylococcus sp. EFPC2]|uniref:vWA domain-containing protein n=1 Tax=Methylococcus sp. EFPC2 TaxID=2812648 RepID=UPI0019676110|nr:vWA domain-containing protein [Methylococcus sp. EFPC2]QSA97377.1 VWA domain-containing protein [Methylococcus sp. EFPC2]